MQLPGPAEPITHLSRFAFLHFVSAPPLRPHTQSTLDSKHFLAGQGLAYLCILTFSKVPSTE